MRQFIAGVQRVRAAAAATGSLPLTAVPARRLPGPDAHDEAVDFPFQGFGLLGKINRQSRASPAMRPVSDDVEVIWTM